MADHVESEVGGKIREALEEMLKKIKDAIDQGKNVGQELLNKVANIFLKKKVKYILFCRSIILI